MLSSCAPLLAFYKRYAESSCQDRIMQMVTGDRAILFELSFSKVPGIKTMRLLTRLTDTLTLRHTRYNTRLSPLCQADRVSDHFFSISKTRRPLPRHSGVSPCSVAAIRLTLVSILHPPESRASGEMRDDVRREAIRRLRYPKYRRDAPTRAIRTHWCQPSIAVCAR